MTVNIGKGWKLVHLTGRTCYFVKEDVGYRKVFNGRDGYVLVRGEPGCSRDDLYLRAMKEAQEADAYVGLKLGEELLPPNWKFEERAKKYKEGSLLVSTGGATVVSVEKHRQIQAMLRPVFETPEDPQRKIYRP